MGDLTMYDSIDLGQIPPDAAIIGAYVGGRWPTAREVPARFPHARMLTIAISADEDADCLDIETGDATPGQAAGWYERQRARGIARPCLYASASVMQGSVVPLIEAAGILRPHVRLWSAHYTGTAHRCGPHPSCGQMAIQADATQWTDRSHGRDLDQSLLAGDFFAVPAPPAKPPTVAQPREWTTAGMGSLAQLAADHHTTPAAILRLTVQHGGPFAPDVAALVNGLCTGQADPRKPMPAGLKLWLPG